MRQPLVKPGAVEAVRQLRERRVGSDDHTAFAREFIRIAVEHGQGNLYHLIEASLVKGNPRDLERAKEILRQSGIEVVE